MRQQIEDDLTDYEEDVERDTFNTYRLYIRLHGPKRAPEALAAWISRLESQLHSLQQVSPSRMRSCRSAVDKALHQAHRLLLCQFGREEFSPQSR